MTVPFDVVDQFDTIYQIRSGTGIGAFAAQYGRRRFYYFGVSKKLYRKGRRITRRGQGRAKPK